MRIGQHDSNGKMSYRWVGTDEEALKSLKSFPTTSPGDVQRNENGSCIIREGKSIVIFSRDLSGTTHSVEALLGVQLRVGYLQDFRLFDDNKWYVLGQKIGTSFKDREAGHFFQGPWASIHHLGDAEWSGKLNLWDVGSPVFMKTNGIEDRNNYIVVYMDATKHNLKATGPIAIQLGIEGQKFHEFGAYSLDNGTVMVVFTRTPNSPEEWMIARPPYPYGTRIASLELGHLNLPHASKDVSNLLGASLSDIPPERVDLLLKDFNGSSLDNVEEKFWYLIEAMKQDENQSYENRNRANGRYANPEEVEKVFRGNMSVISAGIANTVAKLDSEHARSKMNDLYEVLTRYGLRYLMADLMKETLRSAEAVPNIGLTKEQLLNILDSYEKNLASQRFLDPELAAVFLSPLHYNYSNNEAQVINGAIKSVLSRLWLRRLEKYENELKDVRDCFSVVLPMPSRIPSEADVGQALAFIHKQLPNQTLPFDVEMRHNPNPLYWLPRVSMHNWVYLKTDWDTFGRWNKVNDELNKLPHSFNNIPTASFSLVESIIQDSHDGVAWFVLLAVVFFVASKKLDYLRKDKRIVKGASGLDTFNEMWDKNPLFKGKGFGGIKGAKEITQSLILGGITDKNEQELDALRLEMDEQQNALVDLVLALPAHSPQAIISARERLLSVAVDPKLFRDRQAMKRAFVPRSGEDFETYMARVSKVLETPGNSHPIHQDQQTKQEALTLEGLQEKALDLIIKTPKATVHRSKVFSQQHNGNRSRTKGPGDQVVNLRPYVVGDSRRSINWKVSAKRGELITNETVANKEIDASFVINLTELVKSPEETVLSLVYSLKALFHKTRTGTEGDYKLGKVYLITPEGSVKAIKVGGRTPIGLAKNLFNAINDEYTAASTLLKNQTQTVNVPPFLTTPKEIADYIALQELGLGRKNSALGAAAQVKNLGDRVMDQDIYLIGFADLTQRQQLVKRLKSTCLGSTFYEWEGNTAKPVKEDKALVTGTGGIDLTAANMNVQIKTGSPMGTLVGGIKFHITPAMLRQLQNSRGFTVGRITIKPLKSLSGFLGLNV